MKRLLFKRFRRSVSALIILSSCAITNVVNAVSGDYVTTYSKWSTSVAGLTSIDARFTSLEPAQLSMKYFYARNGGWTNPSNGGWYIGLQTDVTGDHVQAAIFSIWNARWAYTYGPNAYCVPFEGEGVGQSCRLPYTWVSGVTYRLRVWAMGDDLWLATVQNESTGVETEIGRIRASDGQGNLSPTLADFVEYYGGDFDRCSDLLGSRVIFHRPTGNNGRVVFTAAGASRGGGACKYHRNSWQGNNTAVHVMGMDGPFFVRSELNGRRCLDAGGGGFGAQTYMRDCNSTNGNLRWFRRSAGGLAADVPGYRCLDANTGEFGRNTYMRECNNFNGNLTWFTRYMRGGNTQIVSRTPGRRCLDANTGQYGRRTYMRDCDAGDNHNLLWKFERTQMYVP